MKVLDANVIIRYLVKDQPETVEAIEGLLRSKQKFVLTDVIVAEIVWVLSSYYELDSNQIVSMVEALLELDNVEANKKLLRRGLNYYRQLKIDWVDCYTAAWVEERAAESVVSYDKDFDKIVEIKREEP